MAVELIPSEYTILIVDDMRHNILLLQAVLRQAGYNHISASNGREGLQMMVEKQPDLVLLDVMMPEMGGFEMAELAKADDRIKDIPIIFVSAYTDAENVVEGFKKGGNDFIGKPFNQDEILIRIRHQLELVASIRTINSQKVELEHVLADRERLYAVVAHDLRSPLGIIKGTLNTLCEMISPEQIDADLFDLLEATNQSGEELFAFLDTLLTWSRCQMGRMAFNPEELHLSTAVKVGIKACEMIAKANHITLTLNVEGDALVYADSKMVSTIVRNFITNAIKFTEVGGKIDVVVRIEDDEAIVDVRDYGVGICEENQEALRNNLSVTTMSVRNEEGTGLGLTLCRDFAHKNGGRIWFRSVLDEGSTFSFGLKITQNN
ncbi:MAG: hybrid sensor histidine kinase/response regulator [Muribaculaceae bacterium]|nr:hybrid sensor histidine kinase/response regulator [Muribaculaceae bacterium]